MVRTYAELKNLVREAGMAVLREHIVSLQSTTVAHTVVPTLSSPPQLDQDGKDGNISRTMTYSSFVCKNILSTLS